MALQLQRYFYAFGIAVGIPCLILGYLAYRGIRNDQALLEKKIAVRHQQFVDQAEKALTWYSSELEKKLKNRAVEIETAACRAVSVDSTVWCYFNFRENGQPWFYPPGLYQSPADPGSGADFSYHLMEIPLFREAQQAEFKEQQYNRAIQCYLELEKALHDSSDLALLYFNLARNLQKNLRYEEALAYMQRVIQISHRVKTTSQPPIGLLASMAEVEILLQAGREKARRQALFSLYAKLLKSDWMLSPSGYDFYFVRIDSALAFLESVSAPFSEPDRLDSLRHSAEIRRRYTEQIAGFQSSFLSSRIHLQRTGLPADWTRHELISGDDHYAVSLKKMPDSAGWNYLGIMWNPPKLCQQIFTHLQERPVPVDGIQIMDYDGRPFYQQGDLQSQMILQNHPIAADYFPWKVATYHQPASLFSQLFTEQRSLYLVILLLIGSVLVFAFIIFSRAMRAELGFLELRSRFIATVSHQFRSPLTAIIQLAELLDSNRTRSDTRRRLYYRIILEQSRNLSGLINKFLDFSRLKNGQWNYDFEEIQLGTFLQRVIQKYHQRLERSDWQIQLALPEKEVAFRGDRLAMEIVLTNLLENAVKYSENVHLIDVIASAGQSKLCIKVRDYGIGISAEESRKIFHEYYRSPRPVNKNSRGSGLGLAIVHKILADHLGTIKLEEHTGKGSLFCVELPLLQPEGRDR